MESPITKPTTQPKSSGKSQEENQEVQIMELAQQNKQLQAENYVQSLTDEKVFRVELLTVLTKIQVALETINKTVVKVSSQDSEEETEVEEPKK